MAQHKSSLEKTLQAALKHKKGGSEIAVAILAVEGMVASGIDTNAIVEMDDKKVLYRCRTMCAHRNFGKRLADAVSTLEAIQAEEGITVANMVDQNVRGTAPHKALLRPMIIKEIANTATGARVCDMVEQVEGTLEDLITIYGVGGSKETAGINEVQQVAVSGVATSGSFKLNFGTEQTAAIPFGADAVAIKAALEALTSIDLVAVVGDVATGFTVEFQGITAAIDVPQMTVSSNTLLATATPVTLTVTTSVQGVPAPATVLQAILDALVVE